MPKSTKRQKAPTRLGAPQKYPWEKWFKPGTRHTLKRAKHPKGDFSCSVRSMIVYLYNRASKNGVSITVTEAGYNKLLLETHK